MKKYKVTLPALTVEVEAETEGGAIVEAWEIYNAQNDPSTAPIVEEIPEIDPEDVPI